MVLGVFTIGCEDTQIGTNKNEKGTIMTIEPDAGSYENVSTNFPSNQWWSFFGRSVAQTSYTVAYGPDGISWPGLQVCNGINGFYPQWMKTVFYADKIWLLYYMQASDVYRLIVSSDGINWTAPRTMNIDRSYTYNGLIRHPELIVYNSGLFAISFFEHAEYNPDVPYPHQNYQLRAKSYQYTTDNFQLVATSGNIHKVGISGSNPDFRNDWRSPSAIVYNNSLVVHFVVGNNGDVILRTTSADLINWTAVIAKVNGCEVKGMTDAALSPDGRVIVTWVSKSDNKVRFAPLSPTDNTTGFGPGPSVAGATSASINVPVATDGTKIVITFRGNGANDSNYIGILTPPSSASSTWVIKKVSGTSHTSFRDIVYAGY